MCLTHGSWLHVLLNCVISLSLSVCQEKGSTWRQGSSSVGVAMESRTEPRVEGVAQGLEEISCGWRLWTSSGTHTASLAPWERGGVFWPRPWARAALGSSVMLDHDLNPRIFCNPIRLPNVTWYTPPLISTMATDYNDVKSVGRHYVIGTNRGEAWRQRPSRFLRLWVWVWQTSGRETLCTYVLATSTQTSREYLWSKSTAELHRVS